MGPQIFSYVDQIIQDHYLKKKKLAKNKEKNENKWMNE